MEHAGAEANRIHVCLQVRLEAVPTFISVLGLFDVEYRTQFRDGDIWVICSIGDPRNDEFPFGFSLHVSRSHQVMLGVRPTASQ